MNHIHTFNLSTRSLAYCWSHEPTARPLVVLHGLGDSSILTYAPRFASSPLRDTPTLFIDLPGFGYSHAGDDFEASIENLADDVHQLFLYLQLERPNIFAHSMGANVAIMLASRHGGDVGKLVLAEPLLDPQHSILARNIARHSEEAFIARGHEMLLRATRLQAARGNVTAEAFHAPLEMANPAVLHRAAMSLVAQREPGFQSYLISLPHFTVLMIGAHTLKHVQLELPKAILVKSIPNAGHSMVVEQLEPSAYAILEAVS